jgi:uncharacterized protein (TIGR02217 family)
MGYHDVQFPTAIQYGSSGGPGFSSTVTETDTGKLVVNQRWAHPRREFNAAKNLQDPSDVAALLDFYLARGGAANSFRFKDWSDYSTGTNGTGTPANSDEALGMADGSTTQFQLVKTYTSGGITYTRSITKPVSGSVTVAVNGSAQTEGADYTVAYTTGLITFGSAPSTGSITAGCEYDVHARFSAEADSLFDVSLQDFEAASVNVPVIEELDDIDGGLEGAFHGGIYDYGTHSSATPVVIEFAKGRVQAYTPTGATRRVLFPDLSDLPLGGPVLVLVNDDNTNSLEVYNFANTSSVVTIGTNSQRQFYVVEDSAGLRSLIVTN